MKIFVRKISNIVIENETTNKKTNTKTNKKTNN